MTSLSSGISWVFTGFGILSCSYFLLQITGFLPTSQLNLIITAGAAFLFSGYAYLLSGCYLKLCCHTDTITLESPDLVFKQPLFHKPKRLNIDEISLITITDNALCAVEQHSGDVHYITVHASKNDLKDKLDDLLTGHKLKSRLLVDNQI